MFMRGGHYANIDQKLNPLNKKKPIYAISFNGVDGYVIVPSFVVDPTNVTLAAWIYTQSTIRQGIISFDDTANQPSMEVNTVNRISVLRPGVFIATSNNNAISTIKPWFVAYTKSGTSGANSLIYTDGVSFGLGANADDGFSNAASSVKTIGIRNRTTLNEPFNGYMSEAMIFDAVLTAQNILDLFLHNINPNSFSSCKMWHDYRTGTLHDWSGNGNTGTLMNGANFVIIDNKR